MEQHISPKIVLRAAERIRQRGLVKDGKHVYEQMSLEISYDGYTISVSDAKVTLTLFFHNTVKATFKQSKDLEDFYRHLSRLADEA